MLHTCYILLQVCFLYVLDFLMHALVLRGALKKEIKIYSVLIFLNLISFCFKWLFHNLYNKNKVKPENQIWWKYIQLYLIYFKMYTLPNNTKGCELKNGKNFRYPGVILHSSKSITLHLLVNKAEGARSKGRWVFMTLGEGIDSARSSPTSFKTRSLNSRNGDRK